MQYLYRIVRAGGCLVIAWCSVVRALEAQDSITLQGTVHFSLLYISPHSIMQIHVFIST